MSFSPKVSIVLPVHNGERFLRQSLESCLSQSLPDWELIVVDDASEDGTAALIREYGRKDRRIKSLRHETNRKLPGALNSGFAMASAPYWTWTSDDNMFRPRALETMAGFLEARPAVDLVYTDFTQVDEAGKETGHVAVREPDALGFRENSVGASFLFRRAAHAAIGGYPEDLFLVEDYYFWLRAADLLAMRTLHEDLYLYRIHHKSLSQTFRDRTGLAEIALKRALQLTRRRVLRAGIHFNLGAYALQRARTSEARAHALTALRMAPAATLRHASRRMLMKMLFL
jgi:glycosyltransferase involved in cell wall biosynthesis